MALNLNDRIAVMSSAAMQARLTAAVAKYALYLLGGGGTQTDPYLGWAREAIRPASSVGNAVGWHLLDNPTFLGAGSGSITGDTWSGGSDITDAQLGAAVEAAINARFIASE